MIDIVRFDHISLAVSALDPQIDLLERLFGFRLTSRFERGEGYVGATLEVPGGSGPRWEVIAPDGPASYLHRFLAGAGGAGLHHLAVVVRDVAQAMEVLHEEGIEPWGSSSAGPGDPRGVFYVHPRSGGNGFLYQFYGDDERPAAEPFEPFDDVREHTLGIVAVNHLSHAHPSCAVLGDWYERVLGLRTIYWSPADGPGSGFVTRVLEGSTGPLRFEVIQPSTDASFIRRFLDRRGAGMHHVAFEVGDWERAVDACAHHGVPVFGERSGETAGVAWREAFIHPRHTGGVLVQFFWQAAPGAWI